MFTWHMVIHDQLGGYPGTRLFHCTTERLTSAITVNVCNSGVQCLVGGGPRTRRPFVLSTEINGTLHASLSSLTTSSPRIALN